MQFAIANTAGTFYPVHASRELGEVFDGAIIDSGMEQQFDKRVFFEAAVSRMMDRLYGAALRFTRNPSDAEDLVAEALEKAWNGFDSLDDADRFDGWLMRILSNSYISKWRRDKKRGEVFDDDSCTHDLDDRDSLYARLHQPFLLWWGTPEQRFIDKLLSEDIANAIDALPEAYGKVVILVELLGFSYDETAAALEVPVGTVRSRLNRGRRMLQSALWQCARDAGIASDKDTNEVTR